jgi:alpha-L-rhamnosidase
MILPTLLRSTAALCLAAAQLCAGELRPVALRTEYLVNPVGLDTPAPRLCWQVESAARGAKQLAYRIRVASTAAKLAADQGDLWDSGKVASSETVNVPYAGTPLHSSQQAFWTVEVWDTDSANPSARSSPASWTMALLQPNDWQAKWISFRDTSPLHTNRDALFLPPARHFRKAFNPAKPVARAVLHFSALGIAEFHLNGVRVGDAFFESGWADYARRAYTRTHDVTTLLRSGTNGLGAVLTDGWYAGYVGYGLLVGYGPNKVGRYFYGKTPALLAQLEIEYTDGSRETIGTDPTWQVSGDGPIREADLIMGESYDARRARPDWGSTSGAADWQWESAIPAADNGSTRATFYDNCGAREVDLGFRPPPNLQAYAAPPIRVTQELPAKQIAEPKPRVFIFDLGQNFAGVARFKFKGPAGTRVQIRYGEMLHPDGRLMTENLRKARATDYYTLRGDAEGEVWTPRFTYHGFQFVELTGLPEKPSLDAVTGLVLHNDTPLVGEFACSDEVLTKFWKNTQWTQRANFVEIPTDCPQRDERLGWMGDAQVYVRAASYNADVAAFFTKWLDDVEEAQRDFGAYPDYAPYPMGHGTPWKTFGTAWTDAGIICPWTVWHVYGDARVLERHWASMTRFMDWRAASNTPDGLGTSIGNPWGDWLNTGETTPVEFIDTCYHAMTCRLMEQMADVLARPTEAGNYRRRGNEVKAAFGKAYLNADGSLKVDSQSAYVLALAADLIPADKKSNVVARLARKIADNGHRMTTGFLGTRAILPVLSAHGQHDLAVRLFQSRKFPSWGYEVEQGANSVWERWDSFTKENGFNGASGNQNAAMNSFSHYSFGAVTEWMFRDLAGIDTDGPGFRRIVIRPAPPSPDSNPDVPPITWARARYDGPRGRIISDWKRDGDRLLLNVTIPANTTATVLLPAKSAEAVTEGHQPLAQAAGVKFLRMENGRAVLEVGSGEYQFAAGQY